MEKKIIYNYIKYKVLARHDEPNYKRNKDAEMVLTELLADCKLIDKAVKVYEHYIEYMKICNVDYTTECSYFNMPLSEGAKDVRNRIYGWAAREN